MENYNKYLWQAKTYESQSEICDAIKTMDIFNKQIKDINIVGFADNMNKHELEFRASHPLVSVDVPTDKGSDDKLIPCEVKVCEPVIITFTDDSTFEFQQVDGSSLKMSTNNLNGNMKTGLNGSNFEASRMFNEIKGAIITDADLCTISYDRVSVKSKYHSEPRIKTIFQIHTTGRYGLELSQWYNGWYTVALLDESRSTHNGDDVVKKSLSEMLGYIVPLTQVTIVEGHDGGGCFFIMPVKQDKQGRVEEYLKEEISIDEFDILDFLSYFLEKYYDQNYPYGKCREDCYGTGFQWNLEYNIYTYDTMKLMLADIKDMEQMLISDYDNPLLDPIKSKFHSRNFGGESDLKSEEELKGIKANKHVAIDFYDRFCSRMEAMMEHSPEYSLISFMGP